MTQEQQNLIELLTSPDKANVLMGLQILPNFVSEIRCDFVIDTKNQNHHVTWDLIFAHVKESAGWNTFYFDKETNSAKTGALQFTNCNDINGGIFIQTGSFLDPSGETTRWGRYVLFLKWRDRG